MTDCYANIHESMSLSGYQEQERGAGFDGRPREPSRVLLLACAALEAGIQPIE